MKKYLLYSLMIFIFPAIVLAGNSDGKKKAVYFYSENCSHCEEVEAFFQDKGIYDKFEITKIEVSGPYNMNYLDDFFDVLSVKEEKRGWPVIFFADRVLVGDEPIKENFVSEIEAVEASELPTPEELRQSLLERDIISNTKHDLRNRSAFVFLAMAASVDALNPCAIVLTIIFFIVILAVKRNQKNFYWELIFLFGIFCSYFILGLAINASWGSFLLARGFSFLLGFLAITIGFFSLGYSYFVDKSRELFLKPKRFQEVSILEIVRKPWASWALGFFLGLILVPCFRGTYQRAVFFLGRRYSFFETFLLLILYNLIFLSPVILIMLVKRFSIGKKIWGGYFSVNYHLLRLVFGGIMLFIGFYIVAIWL